MTVKTLEKIVKTFLVIGGFFVAIFLTSPITLDLIDKYIIRLPENIFLILFGLCMFFGFLFMFFATFPTGTIVLTKTKKADTYKHKLKTSSYSKILKDLQDKLIKNEYTLESSNKLENDIEVYIYSKKTYFDIREIFIIIRTKVLEEKDYDIINPIIDSIVDKYNKLFGISEFHLVPLVIVDKRNEEFNKHIFMDILQVKKAIYLPTGISLEDKELYIYKQNDTVGIVGYKKILKNFSKVMEVNIEECTIEKNTIRRKPIKDKKIKFSKKFIIMRLIGLILLGITLYVYLGFEWSQIITIIRVFIPIPTFATVFYTE